MTIPNHTLMPYNPPITTPFTQITYTVIHTAGTVYSLPAIPTITPMGIPQVNAVRRHWTGVWITDVQRVTAGLDAESVDRQARLGVGLVGEVVESLTIDHRVADTTLQEHIWRRAYTEW